MQNKQRTFIVDDDPFWTAMLNQLLSELGIENIISFENGSDCIKNLHLNPGLVFLDYQMDDINGLKVLQEIKNYFPGIAVVFCTAQEDLSVALEAIKYGSYDYLLKSNASKKELTTILENVAEHQKTSF